MAEDFTPTFGTGGGGAMVRQRYMGRVMNTYPVSEPEMSTISMLNTQSTTAFSLASLVFGLAASVWINASFYASLTPAGDLACRYVAPGMVALSAVIGIYGIVLQRKRASEWRRIMSESFPMEAIAPVIVSNQIGIKGTSV